jgi:hypothetical protein
MSDPAASPHGSSPNDEESGFKPVISRRQIDRRDDYRFQIAGGYRSQILERSYPAVQQVAQVSVNYIDQVPHLVRSPLCAMCEGPDADLKCEGCNRHFHNEPCFNKRMMIKKLMF